MKVIMKGLLLLLLSSLLVGWSFGKKKEQTPSCTEDPVQQLVMEITNEELFTQLLPAQVQANYADMIKELEGAKVYQEYRLVDNQGAGFVYGTLPVEYFMKFIKISPTAVSIQEKIIQQIQEMKLTVGAIRVTSKQPDIKKVMCAAQISFANGNSIPIEYSAQYTEDEQVWVEVSGLK